MVQRVETVSVDSATGKVERASTYRGCTDKKACNFYHLATEDDGSCVYPKRLHDCEGKCTVERDCEGTCGGNVEYDNCGVCGGDGQSCIIKPCAYLDLNVANRNYYNTRDCNLLEAGASCQIKCVSTMKGEPGIYTCPEDNTDATRQPEGTLPNCTFLHEMYYFDTSSKDNDIKCLDDNKARKI